MVVVITKRSADFHAAIFGHPGKCGCGRSQAEAIGDLVTSHQRDFGIVVDESGVPADPQVVLHGHTPRTTA